MYRIIFTWLLSITSVWWTASVAFWAAWPLDFYTQIDDVGDTIARGLTTRHLEEYGTFRNFGKHCRWELPWLDTVTLDEALLQEVAEWKYTKLTEIAREKQISINIHDFQVLTECLANTYSSLQLQSIKQQTVLELGSRMSIYQDGDTNNSDFDIMNDIQRINRIIFAEEISYDGKANPTQKSLEQYLKWWQIPELILPDRGHANGSSSGNANSGNTWGSTHTGWNNDNNTPWGGASGNTSTGNTPPWSNMCLISDGTSPHGVDNMLDPDFLNELERIRRGGHGANRWHDYSNQIAPPLAQSWSDAPWTDTTSVIIPTITSNAINADFFDTRPCEGIACVTISTRNARTQSSRKNTSIESILEKHIDTIQPVSWSDLWGQRMTQNSYQLPFSWVIQFAKKIAGGRVFIHDSPQVDRYFEEEHTETRQDTYFDNAYRCALIDAGLPLEELKSAGVNGAGYILHTHELNNINRASTPLNAVNTLELRNSNYCHDAQIQITRDRFWENLSVELGEIQAFTTAINDVIAQILESELKLDSLKVQ